MGGGIIPPALLGTLSADINERLQVLSPASLPEFSLSTHAESLRDTRHALARLDAQVLMQDGCILAQIRRCPAEADRTLAHYVMPVGDVECRPDILLDEQD